MVLPKLPDSGMARTLAGLAKNKNCSMTIGTGQHGNMPLLSLLSGTAGFEKASAELYCS